MQTVATPTRDGVSAVHNDPDRARFVRRCVRSNARRLGGRGSGHVTYHIPRMPSRAPILSPSRGAAVPRSGHSVLEDGPAPGRDPDAYRSGADDRRVQRVPQRSIELGTVNHANSNRAACAGCHAPLSFELEVPSMSARTSSTAIEAVRCAAEQVLLLPHTKESTQRTSKSACLSCHNSYPKSHVEKFGPIRGMYFGGSTESFQQCRQAVTRATR